ncbi:thioredoxin [Phenylobacterium sp. Root77]|jgi:putative thioredoxin|uniref:thioredoxin family protein n=1 Tax=unclassified Phenylobacterium TaxID=2640670 RepID=UPI0006F4CF40|nr:MULTISPECIES: co-chaperone YbbN [unclassified Phenylobacterium]KQW69178.1 thioredoxin [Phenylobacterium sp. Root1277]KQW95455.1 thioredoxin [Phenylobacterium sp. Root1290]KRC41245.1 thioredoxin [Phenylobacterium sp. Root77]
MSLIGETQPQAAAADLIKDGTDASFVADVIEASKETPVIVDFWATWCGPCRQLGPSIEKNVLAAKGKVKLVKIDIDANPQFAGQLRVQSIPAVFAFVDGRPVDGFMGALPDSQVKQFVDRIAGQAPANATDELLAMAKESLDVGDVGGAAQAYAQVLQAEPDNVKAIGGLARCYLAGGDAERAAEVAAMAPEGAKDADLDSVRAALALAEEAPSETSEFEQRLAKDANDLEARYEIAKALAARGAWGEASDHLLTIIEADRTWNDEAARKQLLTIFEAAGSGSDITRAGRRRLSSILFS